MPFKIINHRAHAIAQAAVSAQASYDVNDDPNDVRKGFGGRQVFSNGKRDNRDARHQTQGESNEGDEFCLEPARDRALVMAVAKAVPKGGFLGQAVYPLKKIAVA